MISEERAAELVERASNIRERYTLRVGASAAFVAEAEMMAHVYDRPPPVRFQQFGQSCGVLFTVRVPHVGAIAIVIGLAAAMVELNADQYGGDKVACAIDLACEPVARRAFEIMHHPGISPCERAWTNALGLLFFPLLRDAIGKARELLDRHPVEAVFGQDIAFAIIAEATRTASAQSEDVLRFAHGIGDEQLASLVADDVYGSHSMAIH